jgi:DNA-binding MarR family transcriptional regulator
MSTGKSKHISAFEPKDLLIGAMLRIPAQAIHHRIIHELNVAGFSDLSLPHIAVLQYPGPDGVRPGKLAERAGMSKQAMNQLLRSLEAMGYLTRREEADGGRSRVVHFTQRGNAAFTKITEILCGIEQECSTLLGARDFGLLKRLLYRIWESDFVKIPGRPDSPATAALKAGLHAAGVPITTRTR